MYPARVLWATFYTALLFAILANAIPNPSAIQTNLNPSDENQHLFRPSYPDTRRYSIASTNDETKWGLGGAADMTVLKNAYAFSTEAPRKSGIISSTSAIMPTTPFSSASLSSTQAASPAVLASSGIWNYKNSLFGNTFVSTGIPPAVVNHNGQLYVLYTDHSTNELYYATGNNSNWGTPIKAVNSAGQSYLVSNTQSPALASFFGNLHAVIQQQSNIVHLIFNDTTNVWIQQTVITSSYKYPTLTAYGSSLFLAIVNNSGNKLAYCFWDPDAGWGSIASANGEAAWGIPAMYVLQEVLYMVFAANNGDRGIINLVYDATAGSWSRADAQLPKESTAFGVSAAFGDGVSFMGFQDHSDDHTIFVSENDGTWSPHETPGGSSADTPSMAILDDILNVVFNSNNDNKDILWLQRQLTSYSLDSWMLAVSDSRYISSLSIPGTHDSTAVSYTPTVGCQTMSITEQLFAGIRYFDLRAGLNDNALIMYHNFYPINFPGKLYFSSVIGEIVQWLAAHGSEAVIVQIKQDHDPVSSTISFASAVNQVISGNPAYWNLGTTIPMLGAVRGRMQLVRRYSVNATAGEQAIGIDVTNWPDNNPHFDIFTPSGAHLILQDEYQFDEDLPQLVQDKFTVVNNLLQLANGDSGPTTWYINFASATHLLDARGAWMWPEDIAVGADDLNNFPFSFVPGVNSHLQNQLYGLPSGKRLGTILMDYPESPNGDLIARIVAENM